MLLTPIKDPPSYPHADLSQKYKNKMCTEFIRELCGKSGMGFYNSGWIICKVWERVFVGAEAAAWLIPGLHSYEYKLINPQLPLKCMEENHLDSNNWFQCWI